MKTFKTTYIDANNKDEIEKLPHVPKMHQKITGLPLTPSIVKLYVLIIIIFIIGFFLN